MKNEKFSLTEQKMFANQVGHNLCALEFVFVFVASSRVHVASFEWVGLKAIGPKPMFSEAGGDPVGGGVQPAPLDPPPQLTTPQAPPFPGLVKDAQ